MRLLTRISLCSSLSWQLIKVFFQLLHGAWRISRLPKPIVSIFGGSRLQKDDFYVQQAHKLGQILVDNDISVLTGGGPGVMEGASCGAKASKKTKALNIAIRVRDLSESSTTCANEVLELNYFFARKWLLTNYSRAFVVFPGGFGTLDELTEILTLFQTKKLHPVPIILIGTDFWEEFLFWVRGEALKHGLLSEIDVARFTITDDLDYAFCVIQNRCELPPPQ